MAVVKCRECGKEISSSATACPNCGCRTKNATLEVEKIALQKRWYVGAGLTGAGILLLIIYFNKFRWLWKIWGLKVLLLPFKGIQLDTVIFTIGGVVLLICGLVHLKNSKDIAARLARQMPSESVIKPVVKKENVSPAGVNGNGWSCTCGGCNAVYVSTCSCGVHKRDIK